MKHITKDQKAVEEPWDLTNIEHQSPKSIFDDAGKWDANGWDLTNVERLNGLACPCVTRVFYY